MSIDCVFNQYGDKFFSDTIYFEKAWYRSIWLYWINQQFCELPQCCYHRTEFDGRKIYYIVVSQRGKRNGGSVLFVSLFCKCGFINCSFYSSNSSYGKCFKLVERTNGITKGCSSNDNTIISLITVVYGIAAFIKNKLYKNSMGQMIAAIARVCMMIVTFALFEAHMWYYTLAAIVAAVILLLVQMRITSKLCPELTIDIKKLQVKKISEIIKSGVWVSVESFNKILQTGLDLLISNVFVGVGATGLLSIAKTIPNVLTQVTSTIAGVFNPELARLYAENRMDDLRSEFLFTVRALSFIMIVPLVGFIIFGREFYTLWLPQYSNEEVSLIQKLSVLTVLPLLVNAYVEGLYYANTLTNKIKGSVLISLGFSVGGIATELVLLNYTTIEPLFLIAGTSSVFLMIRYMVVTPLYSAYVLGLPLLTFYPVLIRTIAVSGFIGVVFFIVEYTVPINSWFQLILCCGICGIIGYLFVLFTLLSRQERKKVLQLIKRKGKNAKNCL